MEQMHFKIHPNGCFIQLHKCNFMLECCWPTHRHFEAPPPLVPPYLTVPQHSISIGCLSHISRPEIWTMSYWVETPSNSLQVPGWLHPDMVSSPLRCALPGWPTKPWSKTTCSVTWTRDQGQPQFHISCCRRFWASMSVSELSSRDGI